MSEQDNEQIKLLREMVKWVRFSGMKQVKEVLTSALNTEKKIIAYHYSDGKNTSTVISKLSGIAQPNISDLWKEWLSLGLGEAISVSGGSRFKRSFDLKMFSITVPEVKQKPDVQQQSENTAQQVSSNVEPTNTEGQPNAI